MNFEQLLTLAIVDGNITVIEKDKIMELHNQSYPETDLYKNLILNKVLVGDENVEYSKSVYPLNEVLTFGEASIIYNFSINNFRKNIDYERYLSGEVRQSKGTWLITRKAIKRLYPEQYEAVETQNKVKNLEQLLDLAVNEEIISSIQKDILITLCDKEYPGTDLYNDSQLIEALNNSAIEFSSVHSENPLTLVFTFSEASDIYNLGRNTLRKNIDYKRYISGEVRQSKGTWLITKEAIKRLYPEHYRTAESKV